MFDFIRKPELWAALERDSDRRIAGDMRFHLKTIQDYAIMARIGESAGLRIAEVGGGRSRLLPHLKRANACVNIEKFEGQGGGPTTEEKIPGVKNIHAFVGEFSDKLPGGAFDIVFSVSVVEHVPINTLAAFHDDQLRILKPGGLFLHAIDLYVENAPTADADARCARYRSWLTDARVEPAGAIFDGPIAFTTDMASNPDDVMFEWGRIAPALIELRKRAQSVSLIVGGRRK